VQEAKRYEADDRRRKELIEARNTADQLIYQTEKTLRELGDKVPAQDRSTVERTIADLKKAKDGEDTGRIRQLIEQLQQASYAIGQQMYAQQQAGSDGNGSGEPHGEGQPGEEFVEGEFHDV
jgi:molecular chaperone DnaK